MSLIDMITAMAVTVRNERKKEANSNVRIGDLFLSIIDCIKAIQSGEIRQKGVDTYNDVSEGKTSLLSSYPNPELNWTVLVRKDENSEGKSTLYKWNGIEWIDLETSIYIDDVASAGGSKKTLQQIDVEKSSVSNTHKINFIKEISPWNYNSVSPKLTAFIPDYINDIRITPKRLLLLNGEPMKVFVSGLETYGAPSVHRVTMYVQTPVGYDKYSAESKTIGWIDVDTPFAVFSFEIDRELPKGVSKAATYESGGLNPELMKLANDNFELSNYGLTSTSLHPYVADNPIPRIGSTRILSTIMPKDGILRSINFFNCGNGTAKIFALTRTAGTNTFVATTKTIFTTIGGKDTYSISLDVLKGQYIGVYTDFPTYIKEGASNGGTLYFERDIEAIGYFTAKLADTVDYIDFSYYDDMLLTNIRNINSKRTISSGGTYVKKSYLGRPLYIPDPYGYNQPLHPCVIYIPNSFGGHKYWMVQTPLPQGAEMYIDYYENPCIYCSNDGINWIEPIKNPLDELTQEVIDIRGYHSDPWFVFREDDNILECWYRLTINGSTYVPTIVYRRVSSDGVAWSDKEEMFRFTTAESIERSQSMVMVNGKYTQWLCTGHGFYTNISVDGKTWSAPIKCVGIPNPWHAEVKYINEKYYFLGYYNNEEVLRMAESTDGVNWTNVTIVMRTKVATFYSDRFYKSSFLYDGIWKLFFTADCGRWHIGYAEGETPYKYTVVDGNYEIGDIYQRKAVTLINNDKQYSYLGLSESGYKLGFSEKDKVLFIEYPNGKREIINRL